VILSSTNVSVRVCVVKYVDCAESEGANIPSPPKYASAFELMPLKSTVSVLPKLFVCLKTEFVPQTGRPPTTVTGDAIMILTVV
jgi:hypothetical protein